MIYFFFSILFNLLFSNIILISSGISWILLNLYGQSYGKLLNSSLLYLAFSKVIYKYYSVFSLNIFAASILTEFSISKYYLSLNIVRILVSISNNYLPISNFQFGNNIFLYYL